MLEAKKHDKNTPKAMPVQYSENKFSGVHCDISTNLGYPSDLGFLKDLWNNMRFLPRVT